MSEKSPSIFKLIEFRNKRAGSRLFCSGICILCGLTLYAFTAPLYLPSYEKTDLKNTLASSSQKHPFGTDCLGRDLCARVAQGIRISFTVAVAAATLDLIIGVTFGGLCVLLGKVYDNILMRLMDVLYSIPRTLLVILFMVALPPGLATLIIAMAITGWIPLAKIARGQFIMLSNKDFVLSARSMKARRHHILLRHLFPNAQSSILSSLILTIPSSIYTEAFLGFIGLGVQPPKAGLGTLVRDGLNSIYYYPRQFLIPIIFTVLIVLCFNFIGEGLKAILAEEGEYA